MSDQKLTDKQKLFCKEYLVDMNAKQAAIRSGYSENTAESQGSRLLSKAKVQDYLKSLMDERSNKVKLDAEYVLRRLKEIDELDIIDILNDDLDGFKALSEWPKSWRTSVSGIDIQTIISGGDEPIEKLVRKIKWPDKVKNLEMIGKHVNVRAWDRDQEAEQDVVINRVQIEVVDSASQNNSD